MTEQPYGLLGRVLDEIARNSRWNIRGPYYVGDFVKKRTGEGPSRASWSAYFHDTHRPKRETLILFMRAFEPSARQLHRLTHIYTYDEEPPEGVPTDAFYEELAARLKEAGGGPVEIPVWEGLSEPGAMERTEEPELSAAVGGGSSVADRGLDGWLGRRVGVRLGGEEGRGFSCTLESADDRGIVVSYQKRGDSEKTTHHRFYPWHSVRYVHLADDTQGDG